MAVYLILTCGCSNYIFFNLFKISRFKQLKEQEALRKKQKEEEIRNADEAANKGLHITNGKVNKEITQLEGETSSPNIDGFPTNDNNANSELKDDERASADGEENPDILDDSKNGSSLHLDMNIEKVCPFHFI